jgi:hypothetical protein
MQPPKARPAERHPQVAAIGQHWLTKTLELEKPPKPKVQR